MEVRDGIGREEEKGRGRGKKREMAVNGRNRIKRWGEWRDRRGKRSSRTSSG